ncbi:hypothetical protein [Nocardioides sp. HB32]
MEETPICASVERDLQLSVDELVASTAPAAAAPETAAAPTKPATRRPRRR